MELAFAESKFNRPNFLPGLITPTQNYYGLMWEYYRNAIVFCIYN